MISWEVMRDLAQLSGLIVGWGLFIGSGISGLFIVDLFRLVVNRLC
jgi:hypothetical protein